MIINQSIQKIRVNKCVCHENILIVNPFVEMDKLKKNFPNNPKVLLSSQMSSALKKCFEIQRHRYNRLFPQFPIQPFLV